MNLRCENASTISENVFKTFGQRLLLLRHRWLAVDPFVCDLVLWFESDALETIYDLVNSFLIRIPHDRLWSNW